MYPFEKEKDSSTFFCIMCFAALHKHPKMYRFMHSTTDKLLGLRHGTHLKKFRLDQLSNSSPTEVRGTPVHFEMC